MTSDTAPWLLRALAADHKLREWVDHALCAEVDSEMFFPHKGESNKEAKELCARCPVISECREYAINYPTRLEGIWGGLSEIERRKPRKKRGLPVSYASGDIAHRGCGTAAGYKMHYRRGEQPCDNCRRAERLRRGVTA